MLAAESPAAGALWIVAFSGGPDSTALAAALAPRAAERGLRLLLAHIDHRFDADSGRRAGGAAALAERLGLAWQRVDLGPSERRARGESPEASARRLRYDALERLRLERGATRLLTAHHRDDQVETVLLQLLRGATIERLAGIASRRGVLLRPLLSVSRREIERFLTSRGLVAIHDPTNFDLSLRRNLLRHHLLPRLLEANPGLEEALLTLADRSTALRLNLDRRFRIRQERSFVQPTRPATSISGRSAAVDLASHGFLLDLPVPLRLGALRWLLEAAGVTHLPSLSSMGAFLTSMTKTAKSSLELTAEQRRVVSRGGRLFLARTESRSPPFSYTFSVPGEIELAELGLRLRIRAAAVEPWMFCGDPRRAGWESDSPQVTVRQRRPGDRIWPLGAPGARKLKELLIDRRVPAPERDRLPLVEIEGRIAWVPGVALDDRFRLRGGESCWLAEIELLAGANDVPGLGERTPS